MEGYIYSYIYMHSGLVNITAMVRHINADITSIGVAKEFELGGLRLQNNIIVE